MPDVAHLELIAAAQGVVGHFAYSEDASAGGVAAALLTSSGRIHTGICIDTQCSLGHCAESSAIAEMLKARESEIVAIVAVSEDGRIFPPCGRCRELIRQISPRNWKTQVIVAHDRIVSLADLMPFSEATGPVTANPSSL
jgi:cytidine deaminase